MTYLNQHVPEWRESIDPIEAVRPSWLTPTVNNIASDLMVRINKRRRGQRHEPVLHRAAGLVSAR
ncbi:hypothetical protein DMH17_03860 [Raoultella planticola]|nr:hypothetical protein [Raoultella planticola]